MIWLLILIWIILITVILWGSYLVIKKIGEEIGRREQLHNLIKKLREDNNLRILLEYWCRRTNNSPENIIEISPTSNRWAYQRKTYRGERVLISERRKTIIERRVILVPFKNGAIPGSPQLRQWNLAHEIGHDLTEIVWPAERCDYNINIEGENPHLIICLFEELLASEKALFLLSSLNLIKEGELKAFSQDLNSYLDSSIFQKCSNSLRENSCPLSPKLEAILTALSKPI